MIKAERGLELSEKQMRQMTSESVEKIMAYFGRLDQLPVKNTGGVAALKHKLRESIPPHPIAFDRLLKTIFDDLIPRGIQVPSAGYLAYIPVGTVYPAVIGEFISYAINRWPAIYQFSPGFIEIENSVIRWLSQMMGLPRESGGILTSGGSMANLSAIVAARHEILGEKISKGTIYYSSQTHHSIEKSARIVGISKKNLREIPTDERNRISIPALMKTIQSDRKKGLHPFIVVANAGSTGTGAVDDLGQIASLCKTQRLWFHVDAAWAGSLRLTRFGKKIFKGIELADSITIDPHKALYTPFGCGALLVRDPRKLLNSHSFDAAYLPAEEEAEALSSPSKLSPELSRGQRGLQVWLPLKFFGITPFRKTLEEKLKLTRWITAELRKMKHVEITFEPQTMIVGFRYFDPAKGRIDLNRINRELLEEINADGRILLSGIELNGIFSIRIIPFGQRTHFEQLKVTKMLIERETLRLTAGRH